MKRSTRMLLMSAGQGRQSGERSYDDSRMGYGRPEYGKDARMEYGRAEYEGENYGPEFRFRDRRGREHYDDGRFAPQNDGAGMWADSRYWDDRQAYRPESHYPMTTPYVPPVYESDRHQEYSRPRNKIGFVMEDSSSRTPQEFGKEYRSDAGRRENMDELTYRKSGTQMGGYKADMDVPPMTRETAMEWAKHMENADGSRGPHWSMEKTEEARNQRGIQCDPLEYYLAMNMMYSDYVKAAEKAGCSSMDFYAYMAKAFLDDKDAQPEKLARYYQYIVRH